MRKVARETFEHLLNLDLKFHLSRHTGGLTRAIDRGTKYVFFRLNNAHADVYAHRGITFILQSIIFRLVPTALEISLVCGILVSVLCLVLVRCFNVAQSYNFGWNFAAITVVTMAAYTWFTVRTTSWR